ncbi:MAG TPA: HAMP domain-containing sensor histidine kinase [Candidatus Acidoferrales bacterium]|nr:HAMP domain-containing sensor histidine kinase [Bryobacteraceae bacterium]HTS65283.1 HAMP domain-containing sensor histidine kinase [Candidatus Acidoferrales bacterium]
MSAWLFLGALFALCAVLGVLQYRWIGEVNVALRERLHGSLQASLNRASQDFSAELAAGVRGLAPGNSPSDAESLERAILAGLPRDIRIFDRIAVAIPRDGGLTLHMLDLETRTFQPVVWPPAWKEMEARLRSHLAPGQPPMAPDSEGLLFEAPILSTPDPHGGRREIAWLVLELDLPYLRDTILPTILQRDLDTADYQLEVAANGGSQSVIYQSDPALGRIGATADAATGLLELSPGFLFGPVRPMGFAQRGPERGGGRRGHRGGEAPPAIGGRWTLYARHRAGSLEAAVSRVRARNLAVTAGVLALLIATAGALVRFTRRSQRLADLQMDFVAGVSHELRTPLTVIHTAAYNLRGKTAANPTQVERYGALIQQESARLKDLVEQVLRYAGASSGKVIREPEPVSLEAVIGDTLALGKAEIELAHGTLESRIDPGLPVIMGDPLALKHALGNLLSNAAKYGLKDNEWVGLTASRVGTEAAPEVEIRVADRGPGIPADEQRHVFDPFFRGKRAIQDQVHGTGLGLNLVKKIVEAHGGTIRVKSDPGSGTEFIVRLPALPNGDAA